jgi:hypothetical protein
LGKLFHSMPLVLYHIHLFREEKEDVHENELQNDNNYQMLIPILEKNIQTIENTTHQEKEIDQVEDENLQEPNLVNERLEPLQQLTAPFEDFSLLEPPLNLFENLEVNTNIDNEKIFSFSATPGTFAPFEDNKINTPVPLTEKQMKRKRGYSRKVLIFFCL